MRLSSWLHDLDRFARRAFLRSFLGLLQSEIRGQKQETEGEEFTEWLVRSLYAYIRGFSATAKRCLVVRDDLQQGVQQLLQQRDQQRLRCQQQHGEEDRLE